jgi:flagellar P-ring protein precursor FlgI
MNKRHNIINTQRAAKVGAGFAATIAAVLVISALWQPAAYGARIKDISSVKGVRSNQLFGFGLVAGLAGTGDDDEFTGEVVRNMLKRLRAGRNLPELESENISAVMVTAELPAFAAKGTKIDVKVSALDESDSLRGGTLLFSPLTGADGKVYAVAQGPVSVGGYRFEVAGAAVQRGHPTAGIIPNGAIVEKEVPMRFMEDGHVTFCLQNPDFTTAARMTKVINDSTRAKAKVVDAGNVRVKLGASEDESDAMQQLSRIQALELEPDSQAVVVINERTGTVVTGSDVSLAKVAISHGNLTVITKTERSVSQPPPFSGGTTTEVEEGEVRVIESPLQEGGMTVLSSSPTVGQVARGLNMLGASPQDMIAIFQALKEAGALHAELRVM